MLGEINHPHFCVRHGERGQYLTQLGQVIHAEAVEIEVDHEDDVADFGKLGLVCELRDLRLDCDAQPDGRSLVPSREGAEKPAP